jgi:pyrroline-5-carboxylate reductase
MATVFLGGGRISTALIAGLRLAGYAQPIVVHDRNAHKLRALEREFRVGVADDWRAAVERAEILIVAVRPASVGKLLSEIAQAGILRSPAIAVSLAAGIPLSKLKKLLGSPVRWARAMPSPVCRVGRGLTALDFERAVSAGQREKVREFFALLGGVIELPETKHDAFTASFSASHGYYALATLAAAGEAAGLDRKTALAAAAQALADGISYWRESGEELANLMAEAATPGGTAAATMAAMDQAGYREAVMAGVRAGLKQARRNAKL